MNNDNKKKSTTKYDRKKESKPMDVRKTDAQYVKSLLPKALEEVVDRSLNLPLTRENLKLLGRTVVKTDEKDGLEQFHYDTIKEGDGSLLKECRGVVFDKDQLVLRPFSYTEKTLDMPTGEFFRFWTCDSLEGNLVYAFYHNDKWYLSTHKRLDMFESVYRTGSVGQEFVKAIEEDLKTNKKFSEQATGETPVEKLLSVLDKNYVYYFLVLPSNDNRNVLESFGRPFFFFVGRSGEGKVLDNTNLVGWEMPHNHAFSTVEELQTHVNNIDERFCQGVIVMYTEGAVIRPVKILCKEYKKLYDIVGMDIPYSYLKTRMDVVNTNKLRQLFPEFSKKMDEYEDKLYLTAVRLYDLYIARFIRKTNRDNLCQMDFNILNVCHNWHSDNREKNKVNKNRIIDELNRLSVDDLLKFI